MEMLYSTSTKSLQMGGYPRKLMGPFRQNPLYISSHLARETIYRSHELLPQQDRKPSPRLEVVKPLKIVCEVFGFLQLMLDYCR